MPLDQPANARVLAALARLGPGKPEVMRHDAVPDAYLRCGCHPDIVERLWDQLGPALPQDCRLLIYGTPALAHASGLILALGMGTRYALRIPPSCIQAAKDAGADTINTWSGGGRMDIQVDYGEDWIFGSWLALESTWCRAVYEACAPVR